MATITAEPPALLPTDRCDRCGAQAFVRVVLGSGDLLFCGHHFNKYQSALQPAAVRVDDFTSALTSASRP